MKNNSKGFMMMETLIVATVVVTSLVFLYVQFQNITKGYNITFTYNTVNSLYATENIKKFVEVDVNNLVEKLKKGSTPYLDLTSCNSNYITEEEYCKVLFNSLEVSRVIFTYEETKELKDYLNSKTEVSENMKKFINYINDTKSNNYRLIVEYSDETYATLKVKEGGL